MDAKNIPELGAPWSFVTRSSPICENPEEVTVIRRVVRDSHSTAGYMPEPGWHIMHIQIEQLRNGTRREVIYVVQLEDSK